jgi:saccharopine dehydrogenase-like NADP-dependent oxidoreductase
MTQPKYKVLLIGSGLMTPPLIDYLMSFGDTHMHIVSNLPKDAEALCKRNPKQMSAGFLDVTDSAAIEKQVKGFNLVISFVPPWMHMPVLTACVKHNVNVATSSYVSDQMLTLDAEAKKKGLTLLNECGLDPGIDIMGTMKVVDEARKRNWKVVSYESFCGGLPVAEQATNPMGYKFSWSPGAAIKASRN